MAKLLKITSRILGGILEWILILVIFLAFAIRFPAVQTYIAGIATDFLSKEMDGEFRIGKVDIYLFDRIALDDVFIRDPKGDTLASLGSIKVRLSLLNLNPDSPVIREITLENGRVGINRDSLTGDYNYEFITDYFDSGPSKKPKKKTNVTVHAIHLENIHLTYDDYRKTYNEFGMDYDHMEFRKLQLHAKELLLRGPETSVIVEHLSAVEKSGLILKRLQVKAAIGTKGIQLSDIRINTFHSRIFAAKFNMNMNGLQSLQTFEDSVTFDAQIDSSTVNLYDVSLFAPALKGMKQKVHLRAGLSQKIPNLKISNIDLRTGERTVIRGTLVLPDFAEPEKAFLQENLSYAYIDLKDIQALRLPDKAAQHFIDLAPNIRRFEYVELQKTTLTGYWSQFVLASRAIRTDIGTVHLDNGLMFTSLKGGGYSFERSENSDYDIYVDSFNLGRFLDDPLFGKVKGSVFTSGIIGQEDGFRITDLSGKFNRFDFKDYSYTNIAVSDGSFVNNIFDATIAIDDPNLQLAFNGYFDLNKQQQFNFAVDIPRADLAKLHLMPGDSTSLTANFSVDIHGTGLSDYGGRIDLNSLVLRRDSNVVNIPSLVATVDRGADQDALTIKSNIADVAATGKIDFSTIGTSLNNAFVPYLPAYFTAKPFPKKKADYNVFDVDMTIRNPSEILAIFAPGLSISSGSNIKMQYNAPQKELTATVNSGLITYNKTEIKSLILNHTMANGAAKTNIDISYMELNDSLYIRNVNIDIDGGNNIYNTIASWNDSLPNPARFDFTTQFAGTPGGNDSTWAGTGMQSSPVFNVDLKPSFFTIKDHRFEIENNARIAYSKENIVIDSLVIEHDAQYISLNGVVSGSEDDALTLNLRDIHLEEFTPLISSQLNMSGIATGDIRVSTPFTAFRVDGGFNVKDLVISGSPVGNVNFKGDWDAGSNRVAINGDLRYRGNETFDFAGHYYPYSETNNLDFNLDFKGMDLGFANGFMDPKVVSNIGGTVKGNIKVTGKASSPVIDGKLDLANGNAKIGILGTNFKMSGPIDFIGEENAFQIEHMPVYDEEGNIASLEGYIYHTNFTNWNCNLGFYIDDRRASRFLVLNTPYKEGEIYYGRAYVTGTANIFVSEQSTEILVDVRTEEGTRIDIPMYGNEELKESNVVEFAELDQQFVEDTILKDLDLSNVELNLNFDVTDDAQLKLIFNEKTGDQITVRGNGDISIGIDALGDVSMIGTYTISEGVYNFVLGPVKQDFIIQEGGLLTWTGPPDNATLDITTYNQVTANFADVGISNIDSKTSSNQQVYCLLKLSNTLSNPVITLDIDAPKATDSERTILNSIKSNKDELQKQFFSLLLLKKFVPLNGSASGAGSGVADVFLTQVNALLNNFSGDVKLQVGYTNSEALKNESYTVSAQRNLGKNFVVRTSVGVSNTNASSQNSSNIIGDMSLEYLINDDGTFRVNIFNESNENSVLQDNSQGLFTQGVGLHYQEDFNTYRDFKLLQYVLDLFRGGENKHIKKTRRRELVNVNSEIPRKGSGNSSVIINSDGNLPTPPLKGQPNPTPINPEDRQDKKEAPGQSNP